MGLDLRQKLADVLLLLALDIRAKAHGFLVQPLLNDLFKTVKGTAADKQNICSINLDEFLMRMLSSTLRRHVGYRTLHDFQKRLLYALTGNIPGDRGVLTLTGNFVDLIDINDAVLRALHIKIRRLQQSQQDIFHIIAYIASLCQGCGVGNSEGNLQNSGQRLCKQRLAGAGGAQHQDVALLQLHIVPAAEINALIVVVYHGQRHLRGLLPDDIFIQHRPNFPRCRQLVGNILQRFGLRAIKALIQNAHAKLHALIADADTGALNHTVDLLLPLTAKGTAQGLLAFIAHGITSFIS